MAQYDVHVVCVDVSLSKANMFNVNTDDYWFGQRKTVHVFICQRFHYLHLTGCRSLRKTPGSTLMDFHVRTAGISRLTT